MKYEGIFNFLFQGKEIYMFMHMRTYFGIVLFVAKILQIYRLEKPSQQQTLQKLTRYLTINIVTSRVKRNFSSVADHFTIKNPIFNMKII